MSEHDVCIERERSLLARVYELERVDRGFEDVRNLHLKFALGESPRPALISLERLRERRDFLLEEFTEFCDAAEAADLPGVADALVDLVVVAKGTGVLLGLPWKALWDDVHRANMSKVRGVGKRGHEVDLVKPDGWIGPHTTEILERATAEGL